ncbi:MAG: hypothetical protein WAK33_16185 [Silvibacterium sp.]
MLGKEMKPSPSRSDRWEVGSEFHWMGLPPAPFVSWPEPAAWYLLGRHAVADLLGTLPAISRHLWVPSYFCQEVAEYWRGFAQITIYADDPRWPEPEWSTLRPAKDDVVLAVNFFGVRSGEPWQHWREKHPCLLLEDHSHDPVSGWARYSRADYAFSSVRKTMPVPDGAILWSPLGHSLPDIMDADFSGSALKLAAMIWKREYLEGNVALAAKSFYRQWQRAGEDAFDRSSKISPASPYSQQYLACGVPLKWRRQRAANVRRLLRQVQAWSAAQPLFGSWPADSVPMAAVFCFASQSSRDSVRKHLEDSNVYCPVHWPAPAHCGDAVRELAAKILTIPTDHRYRHADMDRIAGILLNNP